MLTSFCVCRGIYEYACDTHHNDQLYQYIYPPTILHCNT